MAAISDLYDLSHDSQRYFFWKTSANIEPDGGVQAREGILITVAAALAGMAFGRLVSGLLDRPKAFYPNWFYFIVEVIGAAALWWASSG